MSKRIIWGLLILTVCVIIFIFNTRDTITVNLLLTQVHAIKALAFFIFMALGVIVGLLFK